MWLFFKNGIKQLFKEKIQFLIYIILVALAIVFSSVFGIAATSLTKTSNSVANEFQSYDYSYKYTSSDYAANDTATISPWFAFDAELVSKSNTSDDDKTSGSNINSFPTLTIGGEDGVLKPYEFNWTGGVNASLPYENSIYKNTDMAKTILDDNKNTVTMNNNQLWINFHFGDVESAINQGKSINGPEHPFNEYSASEKYNLVQTGDFGSFYRFNLDSDAFKKSLIGRLYNKFDFVSTSFDNASKDAVDTATNIFDYMLYLNNSSLTDAIKMNILVEFYTLCDGNPIDSSIDVKTISGGIENYVNGDGSHLTNINDINSVNGSNKTASWNGRFGWILGTANDTTKEKYTIGLTENQYNYIYVPDDNKQQSDNQKEILNFASYWVKNYESFDIMTNIANKKEYQYNNQNFSNRFFFSAYNAMVADLTNFNSLSVSQTVMWDVGTKFRFVSAFYDSTDENGKDVSSWYNPNLIKVYDQYDQGNSGNANFLRGTFGVSAGYATANNMQLGETYKIVPGLMSKSYRFDGTIVDSLNTYPTIYDEDILTNKSTQAIFYLDNSDYQLLFGEGGVVSTVDDGTKVDIARSSDNYQDISRTFLKYTSKDKSNLEADHSIYQLYLANNLVQMNDVLNGIDDYMTQPIPTVDDYDETTPEYLTSNFSSSNLQSYSETGTVNMRSNLLPTVSTMFTIIAVVLSIVFVAVIIFVVLNIVKKFLNQQRGQLGNLKSLGVRKTKLIVNFVAYMIVPILFLVPIGWGISIAVEFPIMNIFNTYFNIPTSIPIDWKFLLIEWAVALVIIGVLVWFVSWRMIKKSPLDLLNPSSDMKRVPWISRVLSKVKFKKFTSRMRATIVSTSMKNIATYISVFFIASLILTISLLVPGTLTNMTTEYYGNVHYENRFDYNGTLSNVPTTQMNYYSIDDQDSVSRSELEAKASSLNIYKIGSDDNYYSPLFNDTENGDDATWNKNNIGSFTDEFYKSLLTMNGSQFSVDTLDRLVESERQILNEETNDDGDVYNTLNTFTCSFVPKMFGQKTIDPLSAPEDETPYSYCIKQVAGNVIPSSIKEMWSNNEDEFKLFSLDFGKISFDSQLDQLLTEFSGYLGEDTKNQLETYIYGIDPNSSNQELELENIDNFLDDQNGDSDVIPITINKKMQLKKYSDGDEIPVFTKDNKMYNGEIENNNPLTDDEWYYDADYVDGSADEQLTDDDLISKQSIDFSKMTYSDSDIYYLGNDGEYHRFYKPQNVVLKIKAGSNESFDEVNAAYQTLTNHKVVAADDGYYYIHPFDVRTYDKDGVTPEPISVEDLSSGKLSYSWWTIATNGVNIPAETDDDGNVVTPAVMSPKMLFTNDKVVKSKHKLKIVGVQNKLYDGYSIYMSQYNANRILGYSNPGKTINLNGTTINAWSNAKMSTDTDISDQFRRMTLYASNGDTSINGLGNGGATQSITNATYVGKTKEVISQLIISVYAICIIFIVIAVIASLVLIFLITDLTVGRFRIFMGFMRVQGYKMSEINSIIMWIFAPLAVISIILGEVLVYLLMHYLVPGVLLSVNIAVPLDISFVMMIATFFIGLAIFVTAYTYIIISIKRIKLTTMTSQM